MFSLIDMPRVPPHLPLSVRMTGVDEAVLQWLAYVIPLMRTLTITPMLSGDIITTTIINIIIIITGTTITTSHLS